MIPVQNIYYMLAYAFRALESNGYKNMKTEQFDNVAELCAAILHRGVSLQLKQGLGKEYIPFTETTSSLKGKIDYTTSLKDNTIIKSQMVCTYDDFSLNTYMNRIIKTTILYLLRSDISAKRKKDLRKIIIYFNEIDVLDRYTINWGFHYNRNNQTYRLLMFICRLILKDLIQGTAGGTSRMMDFMDDQELHTLYEKFILEFYRTERKDISASSSYVTWQTDDGFTDMLPAMHTDIMLRKGQKTLIIDAKYYSHSMQKSQHGKQTFHSGNLYQIFTYVKNERENVMASGGVVSGMLLYAKTDENQTPDNNTYMMSGNQITVHSLDLNRDFDDIKTELNKIADAAFDE